MKKNIFILLLIMLSSKAFSQENMITIGGGYSFAKIDNLDKTGTGWRINGLYEFNPMGGNFAHGVSFGYISISASKSSTFESVTSSVNSFPVYYAPKYMFGTEKLKGFVKGALGMQFAHLKREGVAALEDNDFGFYGGAGAGAMLFLSEKFFISAEYEIAWMSNSWYDDGWMNTAGGGIGFKF